jgi:hypothetical protein
MMDGGGTVSEYLERERKKAAQGKNPTWTTGELREELASCVSQFYQSTPLVLTYGTHVRNILVFFVASFGRLWHLHPLI